MPTDKIDDVINKAATKMREMFTDARNITAFTYNFKPEDYLGVADITVDFSAMAYLKQHMLVAQHREEIAWHGIVRVSEDRKFFRIEDILVYPQSVTGATVTVDEKAYQVWKNALNDDQYNNLRYQAHSHVNMGTTPSGVDTTLYDGILSTLGAQSYYIFLIINKSGQFWINIYDIANNAIYEKQDVSITIDGIDIDTWYKTQIDTNIKAASYWNNQHTAPANAPAASSLVHTPTGADEKKITQINTPIIRGTTPRTTAGSTNNTKSNGKFTYTAPYERDPYYKLLDPDNPSDKALMEKYEQLRAQGRANFPIFCIGCSHSKKFSPKKYPCKTCEVLIDAYANSQR
jgi:hypothetical protein